MIKYLSSLIVFTLLSYYNQAQPTMNKLSILTKYPAFLGEGVMWDYRTQCLYWIDIEGKTLHRYNTKVSNYESMPLPKKIGTVVLTKNTEACIVALEDTVYMVNFDKKTVHPISGPNFNNTPVRFNDGKCSPSGNLWIGTVDCKDYANPIAKLYRMETDNSFTIQRNDVTVSNGIAWSPDGSKMYYIDSPTRTVVAFDVDSKTDAISNPKIVINTPADLGTPDGSTIDSEGMLWIAHWGGACVTRWNPATGAMMQKIEVPALHVTSVAFGGEKLETLYITTAKIAMSEEDEKHYPDAGHVFYCNPGTIGLKANIYKQ